MSWLAPRESFVYEHATSRLHTGKTHLTVLVPLVLYMSTVLADLKVNAQRLLRAAVKPPVSQEPARQPDAIVPLGERANYVLVRGGQWRLRYSHWGATEIARDVFWGPERALRVIESCELVESWLDEVWCQGAVLMDCDHQRLLFFGGGALEHDLPLQRIYLQMLAHTWRGWQVQWAYNGILDIARYVAVESNKIVVRDSDYEKPPKIGRIRSLRRLGPNEQGIWFTVRDANGRLADNYFKDVMQALLCAGPVLLDRFPPRLIDPIPPEDRVKGGAWIDAVQKELIFWRADSVPDLERRFGARWPGWSVRRQTEGWQTQVELSGRRAPELRADSAKLVHDVVNIVLDESAFHPKNVLQQMMQLHDDKARLHAHFLQEHPGVKLSGQQKAIQLGELLARLAVPGTEDLQEYLSQDPGPQATCSVRQAA
jgi:hypothetical protein